MMESISPILLNSLSLQAMDQLYAPTVAKGLFSSAHEIKCRVDEIIKTAYEAGYRQRDADILLSQTNQE